MAPQEPFCLVLFVSPYYTWLIAVVIGASTLLLIVLQNYGSHEEQRRILTAPKVSSLIIETLGVDCQLGTHKGCSLEICKTSQSNFAAHPSPSMVNWLGIGSGCCSPSIYNVTSYT